MYTDIGALIAERRREKGMNQAELAAALDELGFGVTNQAVSKWEKGATLPNARQFLAICDVLGIGGYPRDVFRHRRRAAGGAEP